MRFFVPKRRGERETEKNKKQARRPYRQRCRYFDFVRNGIGRNPTNVKGRTAMERIIYSNYETEDELWLEDERMNLDIQEEPLNWGNEDEYADLF